MVNIFDKSESTIFGLICNGTKEKRLMLVGINIQHYCNKILKQQSVKKLDESINSIRCYLPIHNYFGNALGESF